MKKYARKINFYTQVQRFAARVFFIVSLSISASLERALAPSEFQVTKSGSVSLTKLLEDLRSEQHRVRQAAVEGFNKLEGVDPKSLRELHKLVTNAQEYYVTRKAALQALGILLHNSKITDPEPVITLLSALEDPDSNVRQAAASTFRQIRCLVPAAFKVLENATKDRQWDVRTVATQVLKEVTVAS